MTRGPIGLISCFFINMNRNLIALIRPCLPFLSLAVLQVYTKEQPFGGFTLTCTPPYTFFTKFIFADVDVVVRIGVTNVDG